VAPRLADLAYDGQSWQLNHFNVDGRAGSERYDLDGLPLAQASDEGSPSRTLDDQFIYTALVSEAFAPKWEAETAWLQSALHTSQAGLSELQRAAANGQLASPAAPPATFANWHPIVLDLNGDGVRTVSWNESTAVFDIDNSGYQRQTAWSSKDDGFLVLDRNYDGRIDNGSELFSNRLVTPEAQGLASLAWLDIMGDGELSWGDPAFRHLRVWQDANGDGLMEDGETGSLRDRGITALNYRSGSYTSAPGTSYRMATVDLVADRVGVQSQTLDGGLLAHGSDGQLSLIAMRVDDLSAQAAGKDGVAIGIRDVPLDLLTADLLRNDSMPGANAVATRIVALDNARHGTASLGDGVIRFTPDAAYVGSEAGFEYTARDSAGTVLRASVALHFADPASPPPATITAPPAPGLEPVTPTLVADAMLTAFLADPANATPLAAPGGSSVFGGILDGVSAATLTSFGADWGSSADRSATAALGLPGILGSLGGSGVGLPGSGGSLPLADFRLAA